MTCWHLNVLDVSPAPLNLMLIIVLELETSRARLQLEKDQLQNEVREVERRKGNPQQM